MTRILIICLAMALAACVSSGKKIEEDAVKSIVPGQTTKAQMLQTFGPPVGQSYDSSGNLQLAWMYTHVGFAGIGLQTQMLTVLFDSSERVLKYTATNNDGENGPRIGY